jgi:predicted RNA-binding protein (virulence factor B family)
MGDKLDVFIYFDSEDRLVATTETPYIMVGEFALLKVISVEYVGAFVDWGLSKDLLVPYSEQRHPMKVGHSVVVHAFQDEETDRITGSTKLDDFLDLVPFDGNEGDEVDLLICSQTDLGYKAIINHQHWGLLYESDTFKKVHKGMQTRGYIERIRHDGKIDVSLEPKGYKKVVDFTEQLYEAIKQAGGYLPLSDKSHPDDIRARFHTSKKTFKKAVGALYKRRRITLEDGGIRLLEEE